MLIGRAAKIVVGFPRFSKQGINPVCINLNVSQIKLELKKLHVNTHGFTMKRVVVFEQFARSLGVIGYICTK